MTDGSRKAILAAFLANMGIAITKFVGFLLTGSASLLAETVHSIADTGNQALLFLGGQRAKKAATPMHPFGYGRERYFWAFAVALILFSLGGMFALYEGIQKLRHPHDIESLPIAIGILLIAIVLEGWSMRTAVHESRHSKEAGTSWWNFIRTTRQPELPVVLLEDLGALCRSVRGPRRRGPGGHHRQRPLRCRRFGGDRRAAGRDRDRARHGDEEPADR